MLSTANPYSYAYNTPAMPFFAGNSSVVGFASQADQNLQDAYLHATLQQIDEIANEDVEMQAPLSEYAVFVVVDTNIILHYLDVLKQFVADVERLSLPVMVIVPGAVTLELDSQKKSPNKNLGFSARAGSTWLLEKVSQRRIVKAQANTETCKSTGSWKIKERNISAVMYNDNLILDCCMYFNQRKRTFLCSADNNLCIEVTAQGLPYIIPSHHWSSRDVARSIYGNINDLDKFESFKESYRYPDGHGGSAGMDDDDDIMMNVDEDGDSNWTPQHPLNLLHEAVIDHFTLLLIELVGRVGGPEVRQRATAEDAANQSRHAPRRRHYSEWSAGDCLDYLDSRKGIKPREPAAQKFLLKVNAKVVVPYARRGWEWSRYQWNTALGNLKETGTAWGDISISESVHHLQPHLDSAFALAR